MACISTFPPELTSHIAYLACLVDHGQTIRSLNLVSHYFHEISQPFLFHSILISHTKNVLSLDTALQRLTHAPGTRCLFLAPTPSCQPTASQPLVQAVHRILQRSSPTLTTLTLDFSASPAESTLVLSRLFRTAFPHLRELAVAGFYPHPSAPRGGAQNGNGNFPSLTRLHLHGNRNPHGLLQLGGLAAAFPCLTHLRVSGLSMAVSFALELEEAVSQRAAAAASPQPSSALHDPPPFCDDWDPFADPLGADSRVQQLPSTLSHLVIQPALGVAVPGSSVPQTTSSLKDAAMMERLRCIAERTRQSQPPGLRFELLPRGTVVPEDLPAAWEGSRLDYAVGGAR